MIRSSPRLRRNARQTNASADKTPPSAAHLETPLVRYTQRMNRVLDHIDAHLDDSLEIAPLAAVANFSPYHFHRIFSAWMGETLGDYLSRRRLEIAAIRLAGQRQTPILHIALAVGFGSGEAFSRAFKARFGCTPSAWRAQTPERWGEELLQARRKSNPDQAGNALTGDNTGSTTHPEPAMQVTLATLPPTRIAYLRHIGPYGESVARFWQNEFLPWMFANDLGNRDCYGIGHNDPHIGDPAQFRYDACVEVPESFVPSGLAGLATLPGGRYAQLRYRGDGPGIGRAWAELLRNWLPQSGLQIDSRPLFEHYPAGSDYDPQTGIFTCQLCIPVRPL